MSLKEDVLKLKKEKNAIILAHYYVDGAVQDVADFVGDSYALAKKAKNTDADILIWLASFYFCCKWKLKTYLHHRSSKNFFSFRY